MNINCDEDIADLARFGNADELKIAIKNEDTFDINRPIGTDSTLLGEAAKYGNLQCVITLLELGADINFRIKSKCGDPPIMHALRHGHTGVFLYLVSHGADYSEPGWMNVTAAQRLDEIIISWIEQMRKSPETLEVLQAIYPDSVPNAAEFRPVTTES